MASLWKHPQSRYWVACYTDATGRQCKRSTKLPATEANRKRALKIADEYEELSRRKATTAQMRRVLSDLHEQINGTPLATITVRSHFAEWLGVKTRETAGTTMTFYRAVAGRFLDWLGDRADRPLDEIQRDDLQKYKNTRAAQVSATTINHELKSLKTMFKAAKRDSLIADNPVEFVDLAKKRGKVRKRAFTKEELRSVLQLADDEWRSMVLCGLYTGQRLKDLSLLTWRQLNLERGVIEMDTSKSGFQKTLNIPIAPALRKHLEALPRPTSPDAPLHPRASASVAERGRTGDLSRQFGELLANAGLRKKLPHRKKTDGNGRDGAHDRQSVSFHSLRRTATTWLHEAGVPEAVVRELIGHDSEEVHRVYVSVGMEAMKKAANALPEL